MATHSSVLAWEIPWTEDWRGLQVQGSQKRHNLMTKQQQNQGDYTMFKKSPIKKHYLLKQDLDSSLWTHHLLFNLGNFFPSLGKHWT